MMFHIHLQKRNHKRHGTTMAHSQRNLHPPPVHADRPDEIETMSNLATIDSMADRFYKGEKL